MTTQAEEDKTFKAHLSSIAKNHSTPKTHGDHNRPRVLLSVFLTTTNPQISLSSTAPTNTLTLIVTARITSSTRPTSPITICSNGTIFDNGQHEGHDGLLKGAILPLQSLTDPDRRIPLAVHRAGSYANEPDPSANIREIPWLRFGTIPAIGQGELVIKHELTPERIFQNWRRPIDCVVQPGEKYRLKMNPKRLLMDWWQFGSLDEGGKGGLKEKKFLRWERPGGALEIRNYMPSKRSPDVEKLKGEVWVFSKRSYHFKATDESGGEGIVVEFIE